MPETTERLLTSDEVADRLGVSERQLRYMVSRRDIDSVRIGRLVRFTEDAVADYIKRQTVQATA
jgi:excisionase family DNA binding protein